jgi:hypothetical protein
MNGRAAFVMASFALLGAASLGCAPRQLAYRVDAPPGPAAPPSAPRVEGASLSSDGRGLAVALRWPSPGAEARLEGAWLAFAADAPCGEGRAHTAIAVDGVTTWARPVVVAAGHVVEIAFPLRVPLDDEVTDPAPVATAVDLLARTPGEAAICERVPLPAAASWHKIGRWSWGASVRLESAILLLSSSSVVARVGRWLGPLRLGAELGVSLRRCVPCFSALYLGAPAALTAQVMPALRFGAALGLEVAYTVRPLWGPEDGDHYLLHGPRITLRLGGVAPRNGTVPGGPQVRSSTFDVWWTRWWAAGVDHWSETLVGVGWTWDDSL